MSDNRNFPQRKKNALDNPKLTLNAPAPNAPGKKAALKFQLVENNPRLVVYTNDPEDKRDNGIIRANLDTRVFFSFLQLLGQVANGKNDTKEKIENKNYTFFGGKRSETPAIVSEIWIGKDAEGVVWLSVTANNRPRIKFEFEFGDWHKLYHGDGTPYSKSEVSILMANGYVDLLSRIYGHLQVLEFTEPKQREGGNSYNNNNRNKTSSSSESSSAEDDTNW